MGPVEPLVIEVGEEILADLRARIHNTRWPDQIPGIGWDQGTELEYLRELLGRWADAFNWRARERELNRYLHFHTELDGVRIHFVHQRARHGAGVPLVLTHGWPSTFLEMLPLVPFLTDPAAHGIDGPAFDVVIPSLPGYGFSGRPSRTGVTSRYTAGLWHQLMSRLGYERYGAHGSDFGASVSTFMALDDPDPMIGLHLSNLDNAPYTGPGAPSLSEAERAYVERNEVFWRVEGGYKAIQSTKPQTLSYGLTDSPAGLAAWVLEKWRSWSDPGRPLPHDLLLSTLTIYWVTRTIGPSIRDYYDNRWHGSDLGPSDVVRVPTGIAVFATQLADEGAPPREWAQRLYDVRRWSPMPHGGHFAAAEQPELVARDIAAFFAALTR